MDKQDLEVIRNNYVELVDTLEAKNLLGYLYQEGLLNDHDKEVIGTLSTSKERNEKLLDILKRRGKDGLKMLIKALLVTEVQAFLGYKLLESVKWTREDIESFQLELKGMLNEKQRMALTIAALKLENNQLKAKNAKNPKKIKKRKDLADREAALKEENYRLKETCKIFKAKEETLNVLVRHLNEKLETSEREKHLLKKKITATDNTSQQGERSGNSKEHLHQFRPRQNAISFKENGRAKYEENLKKKAMLAQEFSRVTAKNSVRAKTNLQEEQKCETSKQECHHFRARAYAVSFRNGGRAKYEEEHLKKE